MKSFNGSTILVVGGAGFVGSNLVRLLLEQSPARVIVVDNLLSADASNVPADPRIQFVSRPITDDAVLAALPDDLDFAFHLACFHVCLRAVGPQGAQADACERSLRHQAAVLLVRRQPVAVCLGVEGLS